MLRYHKEKGIIMETERLQQAFEDAILKMIRSGDVLKLDYNSKIDVSNELRKAYERIDYTKVYARMTELFEEELAQKIVNKVITEMGTDIKNLMSNSSVREDFKFFMRKGVEEIMKKIRE